MITEDHKEETSISFGEDQFFHYLKIIIALLILILLTLVFLAGKVSADESLQTSNQFITSFSKNYWMTQQAVNVCYEVPPEYWWCEPKGILMNTHHYIIFDSSWLLTQLQGNPAQVENAEQWIIRIQKSK